MRYLCSRVSLILLLVLTVGVSRAFAQGTEKAEWREFVSTEGEFKVSTLSPLKLIQNGIPGGVEGNSWRTYVFAAVRPYMTFNLRYADYEKMSEILDVEQKKTLYNNVRDAQVKLLNGILVSDNDLVLGGNIGREITVKTNSVILTDRMFVVNKRFYQVIVSLKVDAENNKAVIAERQRFLDSFVITRTAPVAATIPDNYQGAVDDDVYRNDAFDFSIKLIKGWTRLSENEIDLLIDSSQDFYRKKDGTIDPAIQKNYRRSAVLLMQRSSEEGLLRSSILISVETTNEPGRSLKDTALLGQKTVKTYSNAQFEVTKEITETQLAGEKFVYYEALNGTAAGRMKQRLYVGMRKGLIFVIVFPISMNPTSVSSRRH